MRTEQATMLYFKSKIPYIGSNFRAPRATPTNQTNVAINPERKEKKKTVKAFAVNMSNNTLKNDA